MTIQFVDGAKIRNTIDTDFSGVGTSEDYVYVPKGKMWVDRYLKGEEELLLALWKLEKSMKGKPFREIRKRAQKTLTIPGSVVFCKTEKRGGLVVRYVDGRSVRMTVDPFFLLGGHDLVYSYMPKKEIWIDIRQDSKEAKYTLIHEMDERASMSKGMSYDNAHDFALARERMARREDGVADFIRG